ncbi:MAG: shikimate dehydrogenase [Lachnospiraceae bacterium]|nr:shikimate dehydrogenase [Lachnospiraceae bacterium]
MKINGKTRLLGLIGNPVEHTLSPVIHNRLSELKGQNVVYVPFLVEKGGIEYAVKGAYELNILGTNVTVPYKEQVIENLIEIDELAKKIGAVNTLVRIEGGYKGYNTDALGFKRELQSLGVHYKGEKVIVLGAGGASRAVVFLLAQEGANEIYLLNRTMEKAELIAQEVNETMGKQVVIAKPLSEYHQLPDHQYLAIQCTSIGLSPREEECVIEDTDFYKKIHTGIDLIYKPFETKFMKMITQSGGNAYNGLLMLLYQGVIAFELFTKVEVNEDEAKDVYAILEKELHKNE